MSSAFQMTAATRLRRDRGDRETDAGLVLAAGGPIGDDARWYQPHGGRKARLCGISQVSNSIRRPRGDARAKIFFA
jgi:hypothetical protein